MDKFTTTTLKDIKKDNEAIISFVTTAYYSSFELLYDTDLIEAIDNADLNEIAEYTLSRMLGEHFSDEEIFLNSAMHIPEDELEENEDFINIDLGYILKGLIIATKKED